MPENIEVMIAIGLIVNLVSNYCSYLLRWGVPRLYRRLAPIVLAWLLALWRRCHAGITSRGTAVRSWPRWRQITTETFLPVAGTGAIVYAVMVHTSGVAPTWVETWAVISSATIAAGGVWITARLVWQVSQAGVRWTSHRFG